MKNPNGVKTRSTNDVTKDSDLDKKENLKANKKIPQKKQRLKKTSGKARPQSRQ